jgi:CheY-like chemotaxis protein
MVRRGWSVVEVDSVDAGLAVTRSQTIDVALCDVVMPNAGGPEPPRSIRKILPQTVRTSPELRRQRVVNPVATSLLV